MLLNSIPRLPVLQIFFFFLIIGCSKKKESVVKEYTLFNLLPPSHTSIDFKNSIFENDTLNILNHANLYNGGGVGMGDFNNDGLVDIYLSGNMVSNRLYLNKGSLEFSDITEMADVGGEGRWCTGVSVVDINSDGWLDLYVSASFLEDSIRRKNLLYINMGNNESGVPVFKESAMEYGLADTGYSTQGYFFDYDKDGDLDLYLVTNALDDPKTPIKYRKKIMDGTAYNTDRLYRNNGNETFTNVSGDAGILIEGWGHAASISDFNGDGWSDIYVSNDFVSNDLLYINNQDGTFSNRINEFIKHSAWNAMGNDVVDINNDGLADIITLEMLPENNLRKKTMLGGNEYSNYFNNRKFDYEHQYVRNILQVNAGTTPKGQPIFSEVAFMSGVFETDWSWAPLVADFDNDGFRDMIITNGLPRDVTDLDYIVYDNGQGYGSTVKASLSMVEEYFPIVKISNYAFRNTGGLLFADSTKAWGLNLPSFSNGGAYGDLDNDGDLDLVINNINEEAFIYENTLNNNKNELKENFLSVNLEGSSQNLRGIGATIRLYYSGDKQQLYEHQPSRGYLSTVDEKIHFGVGEGKHIDSLRIHWIDGKSQLLKNFTANQTITLSYKDAVVYDNRNARSSATPIFSEASKSSGIKFMHREKDAIDYNIQATLPHKLSQYGPGIAVGDVDGNGFDDFFVGGAAGNKGVFFMQDPKGNFSLDSARISDTQDFAKEDMGVLLFDADNDRDLDLYVASGSYEFPPFNEINQDRLYTNNGKGRFKKDIKALPEMFSNGSCVRAADFDQDGDLDLFVGGRSVSGAYPAAPESYLLENIEGVFINVTERYCPQLKYIGMVTDALWSDFDQDGLVDLVVVGEWMPVTFLKNTGGTFSSINESTGVGEQIGWWNSLVSGDFDNDGDIDYIAGNLGLNSNFKASPDEPMSILAKDMDSNGKLDPMIFYYIKDENGQRKPFPMHTRDDMVSQLISIRRQYPTYKSFGRASMDELWSQQDKETAISMNANNFTSSYIENIGNGKFNIKPLPLEAQIAPVYGMICEDVDNDGNLDVLMVGNDYGIEPISGRHDAFNGLCLKGDGKGNFTSMPLPNSGFFVKGDAKALARVHNARGKDLFIATQNNDSLMVYSKNENQDSATRKSISLNPDDFSADVVYKENRKRHIEFYYGDTYLSQSSRKLLLDKDVIKVIITDFRGNKREVINQ